MKMSATQERQKVVSEYYTQLKGTECLQTNVCTLNSLPREYKSLYDKIPLAVKNKFYGCGSPFPGLLSGCRVVDLGCGAGRDTYIVSALVGPEGEAVGVDMTPSMLDVARAGVDEWQQQFTDFKPNVRFLDGQIEDLEAAGVEPNSVDVCISNCVVNLCADKGAVLKSVYKVLKNGGEFYFSDMYADRRLPEATRQDEVLIGEGIGGAAYYRDFIDLCKKHGFKDPRVVSCANISISAELLKKVEGLKMYSITLRLFKNERLEESRENYGDMAVYMGDAHTDEKIKFDRNLTFEKGVHINIDANAAAILTENERFKKVIHVKKKETRDHVGSFGPSDTDLILHTPITPQCCKK